MCKYNIEYVYICARCNFPCKVVEDCFEDDRGKVKFTESDCCGAPVVRGKEKHSADCIKDKED